MNKNITLLNFKPADFELAKEMAKRLGYGESTAYNSTCDLPGLYCIATYQGQKEGAIIKTKEFGLLLVQDVHDLGFWDLDEKLNNK